MTYTVSEKQLENILQLGCETRYDYFLNKVADWGELWILVNAEQQFLKLYAEDEDLEYVPVWPHEIFAQHYASNLEEPLQPRKLDLETFFERWLPGLTRDGLSIDIFPVQDDNVLLVTPAEFRDDLEARLAEG